MKLKKVIALLLAVALVASLAIALVACNKDDETATVVSFEPIAKSDIKLGLITLHGEESTYDKNFIDAAKKACEDIGVAIVIESGVAESNDCYDKAVSLVEQGCNIIFADSFGHEPFLLKAAKEFPNVRFAHATGTNAHTELLPNFYNAFASIYEGRFLAGVAAGLKLNQMIDSQEITAEEAVMGYVGAYTYAEVVSGLTSFYLGAKIVCPSATMKVRFTGSWYDETAEGTAAATLIDSDKCVLISQHADSMGAPNVCKQKNVPNVTYNISTKDSCPDSYLAGSKINWTPYFKHLINCTINGVTAAGTDWAGTLATGSVEVLEINEAVAAPETAAVIEGFKEAMVAGVFHVYDLSLDNYITVDGQKVTTYLADVDSDEAFKKDTQVVSEYTSYITIEDGEFDVLEEGVTHKMFAESLYRSAPYFDLTIDGIRFMNTMF